MAYIDWSIRGPEVTTCNCNWGCPCQFNSLPSHGNCRAAVAMRIDEGHFGKVKLDGLRWVGLFAWPGAIHEGRGEALPIVDERADPAQREAILKILSGEETEPGATMFNVFATTFEKMHEPRFAHIEFEADIENRKAHFSVDGLVEAKTGPITNPITGEAHRARVSLPHGFEYREAEYASSTTHADRPIALDWANGHGHLTMLHMTPTGPVG
ncbi:MAG: DUF1326 domain-containing protein [Gammaproteobacteria bacterium]|nr:DUF1326 domain-containing protein [Gammaproteobacteria bacterium]